MGMVNVFILCSRDDTEIIGKYIPGDGYFLSFCLL